MDEFDSLIDLLNQWNIEYTEEPLDIKEEAIIRGTLKGLSYKKMRENYPILRGLTVDYISRFIAFHLWKKLTNLWKYKNILNAEEKAGKSKLWEYISRFWTPDNSQLIPPDDNLEKLLLQRYKILEDWVNNQFSKTYLAEDLGFSQPKLCIVKQFDSQSEEMQQRFQREVWSLQELGNHDQIPSLLADFQENQHYYIVYEFIDGTFLQEKLITKKPWTESQVIKLLRDLLSLLDFVHKNGIIHREINPNNIMIRKEDSKNILIGFGGVKEIIANNTFTLNNCNRDYIAPEQAIGSPRFCSDIYSLGKIAIQALTGKPPRKIKFEPDTLNLRWQNDVDISSPLALIINKMVCYDFRERYSCAGEVLARLNELK